MKYRVVIRAFTLRRDVASYLVLAELLRKRGCEVAVCCVRNYRHVIKNWKPHVVIINTVGKIAETREYAPDAKIIFLPGEGGEAEIYSSALLFSKLGCYDDVDSILLWGNYSRKLFEKYFPNGGEKVTVCGNPRLDLVRYAPEMKRDEKTIGALGRFNVINFYDKRPTLSAVAASSIEENAYLMGMIKAQSEQFLVLYRVMKYIVENTDFKINLRPHPLESPEGYEFLKQEFGEKFEVDDSMDIAQWMGKVKCIITPASTTFLEAYMLKTPMINIDLISQTKEMVNDQNPINEFAFENSSNPKSISELVNVISSPMRNFEKSDTLEEHLKDVHNVPQDKSAIMNAATEIMGLLERSSFKPSFHCPHPILELRDWAVFLKAKLFDGDNHENFNYKSGYHKTPQYLKEIEENIENNTIVRTGI